MSKEWRGCSLVLIVLIVEGLVCLKVVVDLRGGTSGILNG